MGRYEASKGTGSTFGLGTDDEYYKPKSVGGSSVWSNITKEDTLTTSRQMYYNNAYVESDLVNSYMWDTVVVYIQAMGHENYANQTSLNSSLQSTGTEDVVCKIYDLASNVMEWTTEYFSYSYNPCVVRGGNYNYNGFYMAGRSYHNATNAKDIGFRVGLWLK